MKRIVFISFLSFFMRAADVCNVHNVLVGSDVMKDRLILYSNCHPVVNNTVQTMQDGRVTITFEVPFSATESFKADLKSKLEKFNNNNQCSVAVVVEPHKIVCTVVFLEQSHFFELTEAKTVKNVFVLGIHIHKKGAYETVNMRHSQNRIMRLVYLEKPTIAFGF